jgi:hypothetical protein
VGVPADGTPTNGLPYDPGANGAFTLYSDDGKTYAYEQGKHEITRLRWDDASGKLTHAGAAAWSAPDAHIVKIVH